MGLVYKPRKLIFPPPLHLVINKIIAISVIIS